MFITQLNVIVMDDSVLNIILSYFKTLKSVGYIKDSSKKEVVLYIILKEFLTDFKDYITNNDLEVINNLLLRLELSNCLIPINFNCNN